MAQNPTVRKESPFLPGEDFSKLGCSLGTSAIGTVEYAVVVVFRHSLESLTLCLSYREGQERVTKARWGHLLDISRTRYWRRACGLALSRSDGLSVAKLGEDTIR